MISGWGDHDVDASGGAFLRGETKSAVTSLRAPCGQDHTFHASQAGYSVEVAVVLLNGRLRSPGCRGGCDSGITEMRG